MKKIYINYKRDVMQLFSAATTIFLKKPPSKVAHNWPNFFFSTYCEPAQNQPKSHILFHKNGPLRDFYVMTLALTTYT